MNTKVCDLSELSNILSVKSRTESGIISLFSKFGIGRVLSRLSLEKQAGHPAVELLIALCLFRINGETIGHVWRNSFHDVEEFGKNCFYRLLNRPTMDWRRLHSGMVRRFYALLRKEHVKLDDKNSCYIIDDTTIKKTGTKMEIISKVYDHVNSLYEYGYKLLMLAFFDGVTTLPADFALVREAGKKGDYGLSSKQLKSLRKIRHNKENPDSERVSESEQTKPALAIEMMRNAWKNGTRARYALADSWFTSKEFIEETRKIGNGSVHFVGLAKMGNTKYIVQGKERNALQLVNLYGRSARSNRKYHCLYVPLTGMLGTRKVKIFLIRYGRNDNWNIMLSTDLSMSFERAFELYQTRWNIEVLIKECRQYLGLGKCQATCFNSQIADTTLCFLTHIVLSLEKRLNEYETFGELFECERDSLMRMTLWFRVLECLVKLLQTISRLFGILPETLIVMLLEDGEDARMLEAMLLPLKAYLAEHQEETNKIIV